MSEKEELLDKLLRLEKQLQEVTGMKKDMAKDYNEQIKDIKLEIKDVIQQLDDLGGVGSAPSKTEAVDL